MICLSLEYVRFVGQYINLSIVTQTQILEKLDDVGGKESLQVAKPLSNFLSSYVLMNTQ